MIPGEYLLANDTILINKGRKSVRFTVINTGDRPVQVGSHFHFFEVNASLIFSRSLAFGRRLDIPAGTAVRFEPGEEQEVELVKFGGRNIIQGFNNLVNGSGKSVASRQKALASANKRRFKNNDV
jgi:urease beta subunit